MVNRPQVLRHSKIIMASKFYDFFLRRVGQARQSKGLSMTISMEYKGCYIEHRPFFDEMAKAMQKAGHRVGIICQIRDRDVYTNEDLRAKLIADVGFTPDFLHMWGQTESISNAYLWKVEKLQQEDVYVHFDPDAREIKKYTSRWIIKTMDNADMKKF